MAQANAPLSWREWYDTHYPFFEKAQRELQNQLTEFLTEWAPEYGFRVEGGASDRIKELPRIVYKCQRKRIIIPENVLQHPFPVGDIIGGRIVVRSLRDITTCRQAILENFGIQGLMLDDKIGAPTETGYRAIHFNGVIPVVIRAEMRDVPFELQIKTFAQDAWGYYTHDEAYSRTDINSDARFQLVREMQRVLSNQLHAVDEMQAAIEALTESAVHEIETGIATDEVNFANVLNAVRAKHGELLSAREADRVAEYAGILGIERMDEFATLIDISVGSAEAENIVDLFRREHARRPMFGEFLIALMQHRQVREEDSTASLEAGHHNYGN